MTTNARKDASAHQAPSALEGPANLEVLVVVVSGEGRERKWQDQLLKAMQRGPSVQVTKITHAPVPGKSSREGCAQKIAKAIEEKGGRLTGEQEIALVAIGQAGLSCADALVTQMSQDLYPSPTMEHLRRLAFIDTVFRPYTETSPQTNQSGVLGDLCGHWKEVQQSFQDFLSSWGEIEVKYYSRQESVETPFPNIDVGFLAGNKSDAIPKMIDWITSPQKPKVAELLAPQGTANHLSVGDTKYDAISHNMGIVTGGIASTAENGVRNEIGSPTINYGRTTEAPETQRPKSAPSKQTRTIGQSSKQA